MSSKIITFLKRLNLSIVAISFSEQSTWVSVTLKYEYVKDVHDNRYIGKVQKGDDPIRALDKALFEALTLASPGWTNEWRRTEKTDPVTGLPLEVES